MSFKPVKIPDSVEEEIETSTSISMSAFHWHLVTSAIQRDLEYFKWFQFPKETEELYKQRMEWIENGVKPTLHKIVEHIKQSVEEDEKRRGEDKSPT